MAGAESETESQEGQSMQRSTIKGLAAAAVAVGVCGAFFAQAGPLNPPAGPVSPTGVTLTDIYDAVQDIEVGLGADPSLWVIRAPGLTSDDMYPGIPADSVVIDELRTAFSNETSGGQTAPRLMQDHFSFAMGFGEPVVKLLEQCASGMHIATFHIERYQYMGGQSGYVLVASYELGTVYITGFETNVLGEVGPADVVVTLETRTMEFKMRSIMGNGSPGPYSIMTWDFMTNTP